MSFNMIIAGFNRGFSATGGGAGGVPPGDLFDVYDILEVFDTMEVYTS